MNDRRIKGVIPADEGEKERERGRKESGTERGRGEGGGVKVARTLQGLALQNDFAVAKICQSQTQFDDTSTEKLSLLLAQRLAMRVPEFTYHSGPDRR